MTADRRIIITFIEKTKNIYIFWKGETVWDVGIDVYTTKMDSINYCGQFAKLEIYEKILN